MPCRITHLGQEERARELGEGTFIAAIVGRNTVQIRVKRLSQFSTGWFA